MVDSSKLIAIGSDHAGFTTKEHIRHHMNSFGYSFKDFGTFSEQSMDYPDMVHPLANAVQSGEFKYGILICGSGNGVAITANKYKGIRAAICWNEEIAKLARLHNDANIIALPARFISKEEAVQLVQVFLATEFGGGRHQTRVDKITNVL